MGMFDNDLGKPFAESGVQENEPFDLEAAKMGPEIPTKFGPKRPAMLKINGEWYSHWGAGIASQVRSMEPNDLPARVVLRFLPTNKGNDMPTLFPEGQVSDKALPVGSSNNAVGDDIPF